MSVVPLADLDKHIPPLRVDEVVQVKMRGSRAKAPSWAALEAG